MALTLALTGIAVVTSVLVAAAIVVGALYVVVRVQERQRRSLATPLTRVEAEYRAARRAMNDAAGQSWRNLAE